MLCNIRIFISRLLLIAVAISLNACTGKPESVEPVKSFQLDKYLGTWYEVARLNHSFEKDLIQVKADYSLRKDGGVRVVNSGVNEESGEREQVEGKAYFIDEDNVGRLKVSFFGPFYGSYNIAMLDDDYTMALVIGPTLDYAWILSRSKQPKKAQCQRYFNKARQIGVAVDRMKQLIPCQD